MKIKKNFARIDDVYSGLYVYDKRITTNYDLFWELATLANIKTYYLRGDKRNRRFFALEDLEKAKLIASQMNI